MKLLSLKAQSIIEYTAVIILVMIGLILMRPYVLRSINAHMKGWENNVKDSMNDPLREAEPPVPPVCRNGTCDFGESAAGCCADCGSCGDSICCDAGQGGSESSSNCSADCGVPGPVCPNGSCEAGETQASCCEDCHGAPSCGDGFCCSATEDTSSCPADCAACPNTVCEAGESTVNCCQDCPGTCSDGICASACGETNLNCSADCGIAPCGCLPQSQCTLRPDCQWAQIGSRCQDLLCMVIVNPDGTRRGWCCSSRGAGGPCAGVVCSSRSQSTCCNNSCCSKCFNVGGQYLGCSSWRGQCSALCSTSSETYKENIETLDVNSQNVYQLEPVQFQWKATHEKDIGLIAEEVNKVLPGLVIFDKDGNPEGVKYDKIPIYLLDVVKKLKEENELLLGEIKQLQEVNTQLIERMKKLESR